MLRDSSARASQGDRPAQLDPPCRPAPEPELLEGKVGAVTKARQVSDSREEGGVESQGYEQHQTLAPVTQTCARLHARASGSQTHTV